MKIASRDIAAFLKAPSAGTALILLFGPEPMRTALTRKDFLLQHLGANAEEEMRLTRLSGGDLRSDPAALLDATKAMGFFPGQRAVLVTEATDALAKPLGAALDAWEEDDALILLEAGNLGKASKLRKLAEASKSAAAIGIYANPPSRTDVDAALARAGLDDADSEARTALLEMARAVDPGDFRQFIEKLALYAGGAPVTAADVAACAPETGEAQVDALIGAVAEGKFGEIGPAMSRLAAQGTTATTLCIAAARHFRQLHSAALAPGGAEQGVSGLRPPVFGPRRDAMIRQLRRLGLSGIEAALSHLYETDLALRSSSDHPRTALMERALIRIATLRNGR